MKKRVKNTIVFLLLLTFIISTVYLAYLHFFASDGRNLSGEWTAELDVTKQAAVTALGWLQEIEAVSLSLEEMEAYMQDLTIQVNLTMEQTGRLKGTFHSSVLPECYDACRQKAYEGFAGAFRALLTERLRMAGYTGSMDQEAVETLAAETFGMPTAAYLMTCVPTLLPPLEELQAFYEGSGSYEISDGVLVRQYEEGGAVRGERFLRKGSSLILLEQTDDVDLTGHFLDEYPIIYALKETQ